MVGVGGPYRHYHHARPYIELRYEGFLQPELLEGNFAPTLYLRLVFASFLVLEFHGAFGASVLEFYFRTERPPFAEVVTKKNHRVGNVEPPVAAGVAVCIGCDVAQIAVAVEVAAEGYFAVAAYVDAAEPRGPVGCFCSEEVASSLCASAIGDASIIAATVAVNVMDLVMFFRCSGCVEIPLQSYGHNFPPAIAKIW